MNGNVSTDDYDRELRIRRLNRAMLNAPDRMQKRRWWVQLAKEINARSPEQVRRMEIEKGLSRDTLSAA